MPPYYTPTDDDAATIAAENPGQDLGTELHAMSPAMLGLFRKALDSRDARLVNLFDLARHCRELRDLSTDDGREVLRNYRPSGRSPLPSNLTGMVPSESVPLTDNEYTNLIDTIETDAVDALYREWESFRYHWGTWQAGQADWATGSATATADLVVRSARSSEPGVAVTFPSIQNFAGTVKSCGMTDGWCAPDDVIRRASAADSHEFSFAPPETAVRSYIDANGGSVTFTVTLRSEEFDQAGPLSVLTASLAKKSRIYVHYIQYQDCVMLSGANVWFGALTVPQRFLWAAANEALDPGFGHGRYGIIERVHRDGYKADYYGVTTPPGASKVENQFVEDMIRRHCDDRPITVSAR